MRERERGDGIRRADTDSFDATFDVIFVAEGHNGVAILAGGLTPLPPKQLVSFVQKSVDQLHQAAGS